MRSAFEVLASAVIVMAVVPFFPLVGVAMHHGASLSMVQSTLLFSINVLLPAVAAKFMAWLAMVTCGLGSCVMLRLLVIVPHFTVMVAERGSGVVLASIVIVASLSLEVPESGDMWHHCCARDAAQLPDDLMLNTALSPFHLAVLVDNCA